MLQQRRVVPGLMRGGSKLSMRRTADQMPLNIECVVDRGMDGNEALRRFGRFEALHLSFASSKTTFHLNAIGCKLSAGSLLRFLAITGPNLSTHRRIASLLTMRPRSARRSSTSR